MVALFTRAWIEIVLRNLDKHSESVALFTRAWIEITVNVQQFFYAFSRPLYEGVD